MAYHPNNPNGQATMANSSPVVLASDQSAIPVSGVPQLTVTNAIDNAAYNLNAAAFSQSSSITNDYILDSIEFNFSTSQSRTITLTSPDGTVIWTDTNTSSNVVLEQIGMAFNANENFTIAVTQTAGACSMDVIAKVLEGGATLGGTPDVSIISTSEVSSANSSTSILTAGSTFTGTGELNGFSDVLVSVKTDQNGTLYFEFSPDGTNWDSFSFSVTAGTNEIHKLVKGYRYFRTKFTNTASSDQTYFRLTTIYGSFGNLTSALNSTIQQDADAVITRSITEEIPMAEGKFSGYSIVNKFGTNADIDTGSIPEDIWEGGGVYTGFPDSSSETVSVVSTSANDTSAGTGARTIQIIGLDANYDVQTETITLNGTTPVNSSGTYRRVHTATIQSAGSGGVNDGTISVYHTTTTTNVFLSMVAGRNQTNAACYTIPAGYTGYMRSMHVAIRGSNNASVDGNIWTRSFGKPFRSRRPFTSTSSFRLYDIIYGGLVFTEKSDITLRINSTTANNTSVNGGFDLILVRN